ncbi:MAG: methylmalonyl Co-A mutase-associated GTPase MeaB [Planctomycetota bacterium]
MVTDIENLAHSIRAGNRRALAKAITLVESTRQEHRTAAIELLRQLSGDAGDAMRIGISGTPGVGKSTFIETFGVHLVDQARRVAVLSIDPSSAISGGSILGDKTRMERLAVRREAFIRPSPSSGTLGGVARRTREAMLLCEAFGFDVVVIETVGVGQSETAVADMTDFFLLLVPPGGGDDLQGIKRGVMELADLVAINKADGDLLPAARRAASDYRLAMGLHHPRSKNWTPQVELCSALTNVGVAEIWERICQFQAVTTASGELQQRRQEQAKKWLWSELAGNLLAALKKNPEVQRALPQMEADVSAGRLPAAAAAQALLGKFL